MKQPAAHSNLWVVGFIAVGICLALLAIRLIR
jgi:hypothetical protein